MQFAGLVLSNRKTKFLCSVACYLVEPVEVYQAKTITKCKTRDGCEDFFVMASKGEHMQVLDEVLLRCHSLMHGVPALRAFVAAGGEAAVQERMMARAALDLTLAIIGKVHMSRLMYTHGMPFALMRLLSHSKADRDSALSFCEHMWDALQALEQRMAMTSEAFFASLHSRLVWPSQHFSREMLLQLASAGFFGVPAKEVGEPLRKMARGWSGTKIVEDLVHVAKAAKGQNEAGKHGIMEVMHQLSTCKVLEEYDRPRPPMARLSPTARAQIRSQLKHCSDSKVHSGNLKEEELAAFGSSDYEPLTAEHYRLQGMATHALLGAYQDLDKLQKMWMNLMVSRGCLLQRVGTKDAYIAAAGTEYGVIAVPLYPVRELELSGGHFHWFSLKPIQGVHTPCQSWQNFVVLRVDSLYHWRAADIEPVPPSSLAARLPRESHARQADMVLRFTGGRILIEWSALRAFRGVSTARLAKIAEELEMSFDRGARPRTEAQWLSALLLQIFPKMDDEDIQSIIGERCKLDDGADSDDEKGHPGLLLNVDGEAGTFRGVLAAEDFDEITAMKAKHKKKTLKGEMAERERMAAAKAGAKKRGAKPAASSGAASSSIGAERVPTGVHVDVPPELSADALRKFLPMVVGCSMALESLWHTRWRCCYPSSRPPYSKSQSVSNTEDLWPAAKSVIRWAWQQHRAEGGEECPWECILAP